MYYVERYRQICKIHLKVLGVKKGKNLSGWSDIYGLMMIGVQLTTTKNHFPCHLLLKSYYPREFNRRQDLSTDYACTIIHQVRVYRWKKGNLVIFFKKKITKLLVLSFLNFCLQLFFNS